MYNMTWHDYYEQALMEGMPLFEAAAYADAAIRTDIADAIDHTELMLEDR